MKNGGLFFFGVASLLWLIFRTGTKPTRIVYPCQRAALSSVSLLLCVSIPLITVSSLGRTVKSVAKKGKILVLLFLLGTAALNLVQFWTNSARSANLDGGQEFRLSIESKNATALPASDIYVVNGRVANPVSELISSMGSHGLTFYRSGFAGANSGPDGLIARDDVVLIKINEQWDQRGGTNTDILKELIQSIVNHPDGFIGEIVVADNGQGRGSMNWTQNNAENTSQSTQAVIDMFSTSYNVSTYDWQPIRGIRVDEYSNGDNKSGYVCYKNADPQTHIYVSYPKFQTKFGTSISFKYGIWNGTGYEQRLKVINVPVLKTHGTYGVTGCLKHYMGVQSEGQAGGLANGHSTVGTGGMGTLMTETRFPTLNILDAIWVNAHPMGGPSTSYSGATRLNVLMASTDPVALDYWAAKHVLIQATHLIGIEDTATMDPDVATDAGGIFGDWLNRTRDVIFAKGYQVTTDENRMNTYVLQAPDTTPPTISVLFPENTTYPAKNLPLSFAVNEPAAWVAYTLDGQENVTILQNTTIPDLPDGSHYIEVYANDTAGNMGISETVHFSTDTTPPSITGISQSPTGDQILPTDEVKINATIADEVSGVNQVTLNYTSGNETWFEVSMTNLKENVWNATLPSFPYLTSVWYVISAQDKMNNTIQTQTTPFHYQVVPEFPSTLILPLFMATTLLPLIIYKRRRAC